MLRAIAVIALVVGLPGCVTVVGAKDQPAIEYPDAPVGESHETKYTRELRQKLRGEVRAEHGRAGSKKEPIQETVKRLYP